MRKRDEYRAAGLCLDCGAERDDHTLRCSECQACYLKNRRDRKYGADRYKVRRDAGVCQNCDEPRLDGNALCEVCREKRRENSRKAGRTYQGRKAAGICVQCEAKKPEKEGAVRCDACAKVFNDYRIRKADEKYERGECQRCPAESTVFPTDGALGKNGKRKRKHPSSYCRFCYFRITDARYKLPAGTCEAQFKAQDGKCAYTGEALTLGQDASLDHRDPEGPKDDPANVQWTLWVVNRMKRDSGHDDFLSLVERISRQRQPTEQRSNP